MSMRSAALRFATLTWLCAAMSTGDPGISAQQTPPPPATQTTVESLLVPAPNRRADEAVARSRRSPSAAPSSLTGLARRPRARSTSSSRATGSARFEAPALRAFPFERTAALQADHEIDATGMCMLPGFVDLHVHAGGSPKNLEAERLQTVAGAWRYNRPWRGPDESVARGSGKGAQREERDRGAAHLQLPTAGKRLEPGSDRFAGQSEEYVRWAAANGIDGHRSSGGASANHGRAPGRSQEERAWIHRAPPAERRRADERNQGRAPRPRHRHPLLRPLRVAPQGLCGATVAARH